MILKYSGLGKRLKCLRSPIRTKGNPDIMMEKYLLIHKFYFLFLVFGGRAYTVVLGVGVGGGPLLGVCWEPQVVLGDEARGLLA